MGIDIGEKWGKYGDGMLKNENYIGKWVYILEMYIEVFIDKVIKCL